MKKLNKCLATLGVFLILGTSYFMTEPDYSNCQYEILEDSDAFAKCSCGTVYIGDKEFLSSIPEGEGIILVEDLRLLKNKDPDMKIYNSCEIKSREDRN